MINSQLINILNNLMFLHFLIVLMMFPSNENIFYQFVIKYIFKNITNYDIYSILFPTILFILIIVMLK